MSEFDEFDTSAEEVLAAIDAGTPVRLAGIRVTSSTIPTRGTNQCAGVCRRVVYRVEWKP